ncbi:Gfo/Idh/MocA family protein [Kitasatospora sp. NPDC092948]|uniref:Gfo/Idh/MocA family protein n=1 Tax=Kitasatospora sp. NPDC092948 TaxID=3364088 RepID=UPI0037F55524
MPDLVVHGANPIIDGDLEPTARRGGTTLGLRTIPGWWPRVGLYSSCTDEFRHHAEGVRRAAVIGLGHQALEDHLPGLLASSRAELVAVCDSDPDTLRQRQDALQVPGFTRAGDLLDTVKPDFVVVAVPHHAGREVVQECAARGVHVLKEKPFATSMDEARELAEICQAGQVELMVTLQRRSNPIHASAAGLLDQIGTPFLIDGQYTFHTDDPGGGWRGDARQAGGGCIIDMGRGHGHPPVGQARRHGRHRRRGERPRPGSAG